MNHFGAKHFWFGLLSLVFFLPGGQDIAIAQSKGALTIIWQPNQEDDLAGYRVYYGFESRTYHYVVDVGNVTRYTIEGLDPERTYFIALTAYDWSGNESGFSEEVFATPGGSSESESPEVILLFQNYPNPFNPVTTIPYQLSEPGHVVLKILNLQGQTIQTLVDSDQSAGYHEVTWNGKNRDGTTVASGVYYVLLQTGHFRLAKALIRLE